MFRLGEVWERHKERTGQAADELFAMPKARLVKELKQTARIMAKEAVR